MLLFVLILLSAHLLGCTEADNEFIPEGRACTGTIGKVQNILIEVSDTDMAVSYSPPAGFENCDMEYEVTYWNQVNGAKYQKTLNKNLRQSYNYWEGRVLCKLVNLDITPIYNGVRGETYQSNQFTDKFDKHIDIGPPRNVSVQLTDVLHTRWVAPIDYDSCPIVFKIQVVHPYRGVLFEEMEQAFESKYDFAEDNIYCEEVAVLVFSIMRGIFGGVEMRRIQLGPPVNGSC